MSFTRAFYNQQLLWSLIIRLDVSFKFAPKFGCCKRVTVFTKHSFIFHSGCIGSSNTCLSEGKTIC